MLHTIDRLTNGKDTLQEMRSVFISLATHEFKTPISAISSSIELMETKMQQDALLLPFYKRNLSRIKEEIDILKNMVDDILATGSMVAGNPVCKPETTDVLRFARIIRRQYFSQRTDQRRLRIKVSGHPRPIEIDHTQLAGILTNLISNAFKYSAGPGPLLSLHYRKEQLCIKVKDNGIGIPEKDIDHLFTPFFRAGNVGDKAGSGLGLAIVKSFVTANKGQITLSSNPAGSVFTVTFPY